MRVLVIGVSWAVLILLGILGVPTSPAVFFPRTDGGAETLVVVTFVTAVLALLLLVQRRAIWIVLSGVVFTLGMLPLVGVFVEQARL